MIAAYTSVNARIEAQLRRMPWTNSPTRLMLLPPGQQLQLRLCS
jgi:hypothetical protein